MTPVWWFRTFVLVLFTVEFVFLNPGVLGGLS